VEVSADNWKHAEEVIEKVSQTVVYKVTVEGGEGFFKREK
jgi:translation initiation factor 2 alpha subunit (eIF-2alpha)